MSTVLVLGKHGRLAQALHEQRAEYVYLSRDACDVTSAASVHAALDHWKPSVVINCAAQTDMDACERNPKDCRLLNTEAVRIIAHACKERNIYLIHISSDYAVNPVNEYGKSKYEAEQYAATVGVAVRVNFFTKDSYVLKHLREHKPIRAYTNVFFNPLSVYSFASFLASLADSYLESGKKMYTGVISVGVTEKLSVYDFALLVCTIFKIDPGLVSPSLYDGSGLPRNLDTYIKPVNSLNARVDLEHYRDFLKE